MPCCNDLAQLRNGHYIDGSNGHYIDGSLVYLQRLDVRTNFPANLRHYRFCVSCGVNNTEHPTENGRQCTTLRNGRLNRKFGSMIAYDPNANENDLAFNLNTREEFNQFIQRDPNYPEPIELNFCPYCGREYDIQD
jgi:hypothetical protein